MKKINTDDVTPESLMSIFKGPGFVKMVIVTIIVHLVVVGGSSLGYLKRTVLGEDTSKMTKDQLIERAVSDATEAIRTIAKENGLNPQDISDQFASSGSRSVKQPVDQPDDKVNTPDTPPEPDKPLTEIEKTIGVKKDGPDKPPVIEDDNEEEDLFK